MDTQKGTSLSTVVGNPPTWAKTVCIQIKQRRAHIELALRQYAIFIHINILIFVGLRIKGISHPTKVSAGLYNTGFLTVQHIIFLNQF